MLETLRKKSRKSNIIRVILSIIAVVALLAISKFAIFDVITGPTKLDITANPDAYEGMYVTIDTEFFLYDYVEHTTTTTRKYGGKTTSTNGYSYVAFQSVNDYEADSSTWYFYSVYLDKSKQSSMNAKMNEAFEYWNDETGKIAPPDPVTVTGTWTKMDSEMERYFRSAMTDLEVTEGEYDKFYFYELDTKNIGGLNALLFWVVNAGAVALLLFAVLSLFGLFSNAYIKNIHQYLQKDSTISMAAIEEDFNQARNIAKNVWVGRKWTIYMDGAKAKILANKELIWGYYYSRTGRNSVSEMRLYTKAKKLFHISLSEKDTQEILKIYAAEQPHMVVGYTSELEKMYNKNFNGFLELQYNPAMRESSEDPFSNL
ncbi:MAG: hypothetical protein HFG49_15390 [Lachnospiraceae bacterium]|jgi:hypothetical protein|nr:hypothetical protein [Lachnospiraceae bacterium]